MKHIFSVFFLLLSLLNSLFAKSDSLQLITNFKLRPLYDIAVTPTKNQGKSGTCWSFATTSFIEAELIRMGEPELDISEMFFVHNAYALKADKYIKLHGAANFGPGGQAHDVFNCIKNNGIVLESDYSGLINKETQHNHAELNDALNGYLNIVKMKKEGYISSVWKDIINAMIKGYLGEKPSYSNYDNKKLTPLELVKSLNINTDDYIEITSYSHHPFYSYFILEIPDNWSLDPYFNVPLDDLMEIINFSLKNGYTVCWDGDVSNKGFSFKNGLATNPEKNIEILNDDEKTKWDNLSQKDKDAELYSFTQPIYEKTVNQTNRQISFDKQLATDDHLMHITGAFADTNGTVYYKTKNSWGNKGNDYNGYIYMSNQYLREFTTSIMVNKNGIPANLRKKYNF